MTVFAKAPGSRVDYTIDWTDWLADGEAITAATWRAAPEEEGGITLSDAIDAGPVRGIHAAGGLRGHLYHLICTATTSENRIVERALTLKVMER